MERRSRYRYCKLKKILGYECETDPMLQKVARVCFIIGCGVLSCILLYFAETYMVFMYTAFIGSYLFFFGLDFFVHTGFINPWLLIFDGNPNHHNTYLMSTSVRVMLALVLFIFLVSIIWQYYWHVIRCPRKFGVVIVEEEVKKEEKKEGGMKKIHQINPSAVPPRLVISMSHEKKKMGN